VPCGADCESALPFTPATACSELRLLIKGVRSKKIARTSCQLIPRLQKVKDD